MWGSSFTSWVMLQKLGFTREKKKTGSMCVHIPGGCRSFLYCICWGTETPGGFPEMSRLAQSLVSPGAQNSGLQGLPLTPAHGMSLDWLAPTRWQGGWRGSKAYCPTNHES
ncbi:hypothetical protein HOY82DRAFT_638990 [Tuber indicum]|nr:hypothetical protein HOY82DRAFT_638990 [Tuber indicum]